MKQSRCLTFSALLSSIVQASMAFFFCFSREVNRGIPQLLHVEWASNIALMDAIRCSKVTPAASGNSDLARPHNPLTLDDFSSSLRISLDLDKYSCTESFPGKVICWALPAIAVAVCLGLSKAWIRSRIKACGGHLRKLETLFFVFRCGEALIGSRCSSILLMSGNRKANGLKFDRLHVLHELL